MSLIDTVKRLFSGEDPAATVAMITARLTDLRAQLSDAENELAVDDGEVACLNAAALLEGKPMHAPTKASDDLRTEFRALSAAVASLESELQRAQLAERQAKAQRADNDLRIQGETTAWHGHPYKSRPLWIVVGVRSGVEDGARIVATRGSLRSHGWYIDAGYPRDYWWGGRSESGFAGPVEHVPNLFPTYGEALNFLTGRISEEIEKCESSIEELRERLVTMSTIRPPAEISDI